MSMKALAFLLVADISDLLFHFFELLSSISWMIIASIVSNRLHFKLLVQCGPLCLSDVFTFSVLLCTSKMDNEFFSINYRLGLSHLCAYESGVYKFIMS